MRALQTSMIKTSFAAVGLASALAACSPYDPALPARPYTCGPTEPRCPEGFTCVDDTTTGTSVCEAPMGGTAADASSDTGTGFNCADDSNLEGATRNDTVATASVTSVASQRPKIALASLAICPDGDKDTYLVDITAVSGDNLMVDMEYLEGNGGVPLSMSVLNSGGTPIANGSPTGNKVAATVPNLPMANSPYFVQVLGPATGQNNYKLTIRVCPTLPCPP